MLFGVGTGTCPRYFSEIMIWFRMVRIRRKLILGSAFIAIFRFAVVPAWALNPSLPPGSNFDLSHWYLQLPVDSSGGTTGVSASVSTVQLVAGYTNALYFYTGSDGAMVFWVPVTGAHTSGSDYPRCELREELSPGDTSVNWIGYGAHILDVQCKVLQVPSTGKVIIGQVKGYSGAALPLVKIQYESGTVYGYIKTNANNDASDKKYTYAIVGLSNSITCQVKVVNGLVSVTVNGATNSLNVFTTDPNWATNTVYFKAGDYCQDNVGTTNEGARVAIYAVNAYHAPSITNQPTSRTILAGTNTTFSVGALANGTLRYQWQFNATNALARATNAFLTITNAQSTNAGNYSVVVTDSFGSVTSVVATLTVAAGPPPTLGITASGTNAIISWLSGTDPGFVLQSTTNLASPTWSSAGTPATIGNQNIVTNALNWNAQFYRLKK
jgi:hypothetical protein